MTQINFTIDANQFLEEVLQSDLNTATKGIITALLNQVMEVERDTFIQASAYERNDQRSDYRNGYYDREYVIKPGKIKLKVPRTRSGEFSPSIFEKYERMDQSLILSMVEMVVNGVSTRRVTTIIEELVGESVSHSFVSEATKRLEPDIKAFCGRSLTYSYFKYLFVDALYIKVDEGNRTVQKAVYLAQGIREDGFRDLVGFMIADIESKETWSEFFQNLKARGLETPHMIISDAHQGLKSAVEIEFMGAKWQRCVVHFLRNIISYMPRKNSQHERNLVKKIFQASTRQHAIEFRDAFMNAVKNNPKYDKAVKILDDGFFDAIQYTAEPVPFQVNLRTTNSMERINREIRRRQRVIGKFPNMDSAYRLIGAVLMDIHDNFQKSRRRLLNPNMA